MRVQRDSRNRPDWKWITGTEMSLTRSILRCVKILVLQAKQLRCKKCFRRLLFLQSQTILCHYGTTTKYLYGELLSDLGICSGKSDSWGKLCLRFEADKTGYKFIETKFIRIFVFTKYSPQISCFAILQNFMLGWIWYKFF